jgi:tRNA uridine 5-carboxymethylaminomethyl modification enzyme
MNKNYDVIVVGGGHAGIEASLAAARMGQKTLLLTMKTEAIGRMSCNPAIGGQAKGQLVRELDALGGEMARIIDKAGVHFKMLNKSKGPAVWSPRAQADRYLYEKYAQEAILNTKKLDVLEGIATEVLSENETITGVKISNQVILCKALILTTGTFLNGKIHIGLKNYSSGRAGEPPAIGLTESLKKLGFEVGRLKTGTPPRLDKNTIDFSKVELQEADNPPEPFSFRDSEIKQKQIPMYIAYTNENTHEILRTGFDKSPMFQGLIEGTGPRYCPSIEDKINRFSERNRHQLFLEPEGYDTDEVYVNGFSTSLPEEVQIKAIHSVPGLEKAQFIRLGYAIEYDYFEPYQLNNTMETRKISGLYFAGQINGTSGYEEAATQGFVAGVNASLKIKEKKPLIFSRSESYIGVLIDDLINKSTKEPYRMFTSSAEFRLLLRHDNADLRLMKKGFELGLIEKKFIDRLEEKEHNIEKVMNGLKNTLVKSAEFDLIKEKDQKTILHSETMYKILKRPEITIKALKSLNKIKILNEVSEEILNHVEFEVKYEGYISRQIAEINKFKKNEQKKIPDDFNYDEVSSLSNEAREKLKKIRPNSIGQASRISGVRPSDINILIVFLEVRK